MGVKNGVTLNNRTRRSRSPRTDFNRNIIENTKQQPSELVNKVEIISANGNQGSISENDVQSEVSHAGQRSNYGVPRWVWACVILVLYLLFFGCCLSYSWVHLFGDSMCDIQKDLCRIQISGCLMIMLSLLVFLFNFVFHLANFKSANIQRHYIRIQFMVPVVCAQSWLFMYATPGIIIAYSAFAEAFKTFSLYCVLHMFMNFFWQKKGKDMRPFMPVSQVVGFQFVRCFPCIRAIPSVREFYITTIVGAMQCVLFRPIAFVFLAVMNLQFEDDRIWFYAAKGVNILQWVSQCYAIYAVLLWARNLRDVYYPMSPLIKHFGLMAFHILMPTLFPQVFEILVQYQLLDWEDLLKGTDKQNLHLKLQGFTQSACGLLGALFMTAMYSSRDVQYFSNEGSPRLKITEALSQLLALSDDLKEDFRLMSSPQQEESARTEAKEPDSVFDNIPNIETAKNVSSKKESSSSEKYSIKVDKTGDLL